MRYAVFTDVHANLEALEAVLAKIDMLAQTEPIDEIWFLGDLVGYGPNPNECIATLRKRTNVIIAGNHDWAAVGKIDLEDFSSAARVSAEWTAAQLSEENRDFLKNLPEQIEKGECTLVHGSPYGPLWEYLTSEVLAERSFQYFSTRYCLVGHTHVPIIFQQRDITNEPTHPLNSDAHNTPTSPLFFDDSAQDDTQEHDDDMDEETAEMVAIRLTNTAAQTTAEVEPVHLSSTTSDQHDASDVSSPGMGTPAEITEAAPAEEDGEQAIEEPSEGTIASAEERINQEIEELLTLLGLSQSMVQVTNEMLEPPLGNWQTPDNYRAIINPGGVGQPRDGDARAAFMIYDTEKGFTFYRVPYAFEKTQEKIIKAGLPTYLATRLAYGR